MKKMIKLSLSSLASDEIQKKEQKMIVGGAGCGCGCTATTCTNCEDMQVIETYVYYNGGLTNAQSDVSNVKLDGATNFNLTSTSAGR